MTVAIAFKSGALRLEFDGDAILTVNPDSMYEAWTFVTDSQMLFVCLPGGGLAMWTGGSE